MREHLFRRLRMASLSGAQVLRWTESAALAGVPMGGPLAANLSTISPN